MANRCLLAVTRLESFKEWLINNDWEILLPSKNNYEVLRAKNKQLKHTLIIYSKNSNLRGNEIQHLSVRDVDVKFVRQFLKGENE